MSYSTKPAKDMIRRQQNFDSYMEERRSGRDFYVDYGPAAVRANTSVGARNVCEDNRGRQFIAMPMP